MSQVQKQVRITKGLSAPFKIEWGKSIGNKSGKAGGDGSICPVVFHSDGFRSPFFFILMYIVCIFYSLGRSGYFEGIKEGRVALPDVDPKPRLLSLTVGVLITFYCRLIGF